MTTFLEVAHVAWHTLMWLFSLTAITVCVLVLKGKLTLPKDLPRAWRIASLVLAVLLFGGVLLPRS